MMGPPRLPQSRRSALSPRTAPRSTGYTRARALCPSLPHSHDGTPSAASAMSPTNSTSTASRSFPGRWKYVAK
uniref:Uncharacterized protein n=1 Tax=Arundo donax TaxID=35708 RepID=A0A0A9AJ21_ARUDO